KPREIQLPSKKRRRRRDTPASGATTVVPPSRPTGSAPSGSPISFEATTSSPAAEHEPKPDGGPTPPAHEKPTVNGEGAPPSTPTPSAPPSMPDAFFAPLDDLELQHAADPDIFNPAVEYLANSRAVPPAPPPRS